MFKGSNDFEFAKFPFKTKYSNTVNYYVSSNYLFSRGKQEKKMLKQFFDYIYCKQFFFYLLIFRGNSMIFEGSPNSLTESYFTGELRLGES